jgi:hypothetical protein
MYFSSVFHRKYEGRISRRLAPYPVQSQQMGVQRVEYGFNVRTSRPVSGACTIVNRLNETSTQTRNRGEGPGEGPGTVSSSDANSRRALCFCTVERVNTGSKQASYRPPKSWDRRIAQARIHSLGALHSVNIVDY